jgi:purine-binding chemotaxis protein CheW
MDEKQRFSSFFVANVLFGIAVEKVQEVAGSVEMTPVPLAPAKVRGLINLRGQIVTAIDLRTCLELGERPIGERPVNVILHANDGYASLLVDRVGEIVEVDEIDFELPPETLRGTARQLIRGSYKLDKELMHVLDLEQALRVAGS